MHLKYVNNHNVRLTLTWKKNKYPLRVKSKEAIGTYSRKKYPLWDLLQALRRFLQQVTRCVPPEKLRKI